jgi:hypothetical protein
MGDSNLHKGDQIFLFPDWSLFSILAIWLNKTRVLQEDYFKSNFFISNYLFRINILWYVVGVANSLDF